MSKSNTDLAHAFAEICLQAALPVMEVYAQDFTPEEKEDRSPVTQADKRAEVVILEALKLILPDTPVLAEESFSEGVRPEVSDRFLLVDPVDGTKEFIKKNGEFTINIALIENGVPVAGCVYAPALERLYIGADGKAAAGAAKPGDRFDAATLSPIRTRDGSDTTKIAVMSRSHADEETRAFAEKQGVTETISAGSSLKFCRVAEAAADLYPRFGPTMEWDTAAGHAVVNGAGGAVTRPDGSPFLYGKVADGYLNGPFVVWARPGA